MEILAYSNNIVKASETRSELWDKLPTELKYHE